MFFTIIFLRTCRDAVRILPFFLRHLSSRRLSTDLSAKSSLQIGHQAKVRASLRPTLTWFLGSIQICTTLETSACLFLERGRPSAILRTGPTIQTCCSFWFPFKVAFYCNSPLLIEIKGLTLNSEPYYNEAGYDRQKDTASGMENAKSYNEFISVKLCDHVISTIRFKLTKSQIL